MPPSIGMHNAFGDLISSPEKLTRAERIDVLRKLAGALQADARRDHQWLGVCLSQWLEQGGPLDSRLGVRANPGSHSTPQQRVRRAAIDDALLRLSMACGGDAEALAAIKGAPCSATALELVHRLQRLRGPASLSAFTRARLRSSRPR